MADRGVVILVEDDEAVRGSLSWYLGCEGFAVVEHAAPSAFFAAPRPASPHCVILDLRLPEISGIDLLERLRGAGDGAPVILITGHGSTGAARDARDHGAFAFFEKPLDTARLVACLDEAIATQRGARG